jgi:hypothetical protein
VNDRCPRLFLSLVGVFLISLLGCENPARIGADHPTTLAPGAQTQEPAAAAPATSSRQLQPQITFATTVCDFGEVSPGKKCEGRFEFTNTGDGVLKIAEVKKCCGVVAEPEQQELAPGQTGVLHVKYQAARSAGRMMRQLHVNSNDPAHPSVALMIKAQIAAKVACKPQMLMLRLKGENAGCPEITLTSTDNQPFSVKAFTSTDDCLTADVDTSAQATQFVLQPIADLEKLQSHSSGRIQITVTHPECDGLDVLVPFSVLPKFGFNPTALFAFDARPGTPIVRDLSMLNRYREEFEIESVSSKYGSANVVEQARLRNGYRFKVKITPPPHAIDKTNRVFSDVLYVNTRDGERLAINVYVRYATDNADRDVPVAQR